jgi:hypothetical protein
MSDRSDVLDALKNVEDPELDMNIVDLGLVYGVELDDAKGHVHIDLTLTWDPRSSATSRWNSRRSRTSFAWTLTSCGARSGTPR